MLCVYDDHIDLEELDKSELFSFCKKRNFNLSKIKTIHNFINSKYQEYDIEWKAKLYLYVNNIDSPNKCYCGNWTTFVSTTKGFREFCSAECAHKSNKLIERRKKTNIEKWGVENPMQSDFVKSSFKSSIIKKWGVDNISKLESIKKKKEISMISKFGVKFNSQREEVRISNSNRISSYNKENNTKRHTEYWIDKLSKLNLKFISKELNSIIEIKCPFKNHTFKIHKTTYNDRVKNNTPICTICNPVDDFSSHKENEIIDWLSSEYNGEIIKSYRDSLEIDIYLPQLKIGLEFNGLYWHSDVYKEKNYHKFKSEHFNKKGIRIFHIWEDDWIFKKDIIKSQILNLIGKSNRIPARKCEVKIISDTKMSKDFLIKNHIQGHVSSIIKIGLFYDEELVSLMTFDKFEGRKKMKLREWNLNRFCNKLNYSVVGGFTKLLRFFINNYQPIKIISYSDSSWSSGKVYENSGFSCTKEILPDYKYIIKDVRINKSRFRKNKTGMSERELKTNKIWDCGKKKWEINY